MIITTRYSVEYDEEKELYTIRSSDAPICPDCELLMSGYDTRRRHVIDRDGCSRWYSLRRFRCLSCKKLHLQIPDFIQKNKHYEKSVIQEARVGQFSDCPAEDSTIRRWRK